MNRDIDRSDLATGSLTGTLQIDTAGLIADCDDAAGHVLSRDPAWVSGQSIVELLPESFHSPLEAALHQLKNSGEAWIDGQRLETPVQRPDETRLDVELEFTVSNDEPAPVLTCTIRDVTPSGSGGGDQRLEQALLTAQHSVSLDGISIVSPDGEILFYNNRYAELWDIPLEILEARSIAEVRKATSERVADPEQDYYHGFEYHDDSREIAHDEVLLRDGRTLERHSAPVIGSDGTYYGHFWSYRDITAYREAQDQLRTQAEHFAALVATNPDIVASLDVDGTIISANPSIYSNLGYTPEEVAGKALPEFFEPEHQDEIRAHITAAAGGSLEQCESTALHKDGHAVLLRVKLIPISHDEHVSFWLVASDATAEKRAMVNDQKVRTSLEVAQRVARLGSFEWDLATNRLFWSDGLYEIFGVDPNHYRPSFDGLLELVHPDDQTELVESVDRTLRERTPYEMDVRIIRPDGKHRVLHAHGEAIADSRDVSIGMVGTAVDITERKREEEALQQIVSLLEEKSQALELKTSEQEAFIYSVSHDLRSPLISIQGMADILAADHLDELDCTAQQYLQRIVANVCRLQEMLSGLLELSRIGRTEHGSRHDVDLHNIVTGIISDIRDTDRGREAEIVVENLLPTVRANYSRMVQLFTNLLDNAIKYTPPDRVPRISVDTAWTDAGWRISVSDNGIGMAGDQLMTATGMFARLPQGQRLNPGGSGLGLAIVNRIIQTHGGTMHFDSVEDEGTTISFTLT